MRLRRCATDSNPDVRSLIRRGRARAPLPVERPPPTTLVARAHLSPSPTASIARRRARGRERRGRRPPAVIPPRASSRRPRGVRRGSLVSTAVRAAASRAIGADDDDASRPRLAASARGAELAIASGRVVRTFRDEDDFERLLGTFECPLPRPDADPSLARVARLSWAADGSALAILVRSGDIHVITRVGARAHPTRARDRPMGARGVPRGIALALAPGGGWDLSRRARVLTPETHRETRAPRGGWRRG